MGFRGEALAAISSVSRFTIKSRHMDETVGSMLVISNEMELKKPTILSYDGARGTVIMVEDLFYNVPARSKFLKRSATEYAHILELVRGSFVNSPKLTLLWFTMERKFSGLMKLMELILLNFANSH